MMVARSLPARAPPMHYRDNLRRGHFWTPTGGQNSTPIDSLALWQGPVAPHTRGSRAHSAIEAIWRFESVPISQRRRFGLWPAIGAIQVLVQKSMV